jgi:Abortive infection alpha
MADNPVTGAVDAAKAVDRRPRPGGPRVHDPAGRLAHRPRPTVVRAAPGLARVAAVSAFHALSWGVGASVAGANYLARRALDGQPATTIVQDAANDLRGAALRALGVQVESPNAGLGLTLGGADRGTGSSRATTKELQRRGEELMRRSNDVHVVEDTHPAFARILSEITPDEARILRFIYLEGPQPAIDIRTWRPLGIGSELVAGGLSMIAEHAGLRNVDRIELYLTNLSRLGLLDLSKEQVSNPTRYQVIEAQPKVAAAIKAAGRSPKIVQRSILLTAFGAEFVRTCLPLNGRVGPARTLRPLPVAKDAEIAEIAEDAEIAEQQD